MKLFSIRNKATFFVSVFGLLGLGWAFTAWLAQAGALSAPELLSALASAVLFAAVCLRFVPGWMRSWQRTASRSLCPATTDTGEREPPFMVLRIFALIVALNALIVLLVFLLRLLTGHPESFKASLEFWRCTDSGHYLDISRDWYLSEGEWDRLVQLVFLPGYPLVVRLFTCLTRYDLYAGLLVSALSFSGAGCVLYRLLRLDYSHAEAIRTIRYLCLLPGVFFFTAPMSESLFLLLCASCLYCTRTEKWTLGCLFGGLAAFTRSLGLTLLIPLLFELIAAAAERRRCADTDGKAGYPAVRWISLLMVPLGFALYCWINYTVSGDPFRFMEYQSRHWHQQPGWFFHTAAYQMKYAVSALTDEPTNAFGLWIPNLLSVYSSLVFMLLAEKKMRPGYVAWFIAYYVVSVGATWLLSAPRYLLALIPVPLSVSLTSGNKRADAVLTVCCVCLSLLYLYCFVMRWNVW